MDVDSGLLHPPRALFELPAVPIVLDFYDYAMWVQIRGNNAGLTVRDEEGLPGAFTTPPTPTVAITRNFAQFITHNMQHATWWRAGRAYRYRAWDHPRPGPRWGWG